MKEQTTELSRKVDGLGFENDIGAGGDDDDDYNDGEDGEDGDRETLSRELIGTLSAKNVWLHT